MISGNTLLTVACEYCRCAPSDFVCHAGLAIRQPPCSITPRHRGESATKTIKFFVAHTVNYGLCNNHTRIDWVLLNFTLVIQQNYHQPGRKFEKLFCAVGRLSCQLDLSKAETSKFRSEFVFDIVNGGYILFWVQTSVLLKFYRPGMCRNRLDDGNIFMQCLHLLNDILSHFPDDFWRKLSSNKVQTD